MRFEVATLGPSNASCDFWKIRGCRARCAYGVRWRWRFRGDKTGVPTLAESLDDCQDDVLFCRLIIIQLGKLGDRRGVAALLKHLPEVQNRREMVDSLGDIGDPIAVPALVERLRHDEYVPVRAQAARALAKIGRVDVLPALESAAHQDTEESVAAAAREAMAALRSGRPG